MDPNPSEKSAGDWAHDAGRLAISAIPTFGGPLQVLFETVFTAPLEKRKERWMNELAGVVDELQRRLEGLTPELLATNDAFITTAIQASQAAMRTHQDEKIEALRNAVLNSAMPGAIESDEQLIFLRLVDQFTTWHLRILSFFSSPVDWMQRHGVTEIGLTAGGVESVLEHAMPLLRGRKDLYEQIIRDLQVEGMIHQGQFLGMTMTGRGMVEARTSARGKRFLAFITSPGPA